MHENSWSQRAPHSNSKVRFGPFELDFRSAELLKGNLRVRLQDQPFQILIALLERPGEVVLREEIRQKLWPDDTTVDFDQSINAAVKRLREALRDSADQPRYIETLHRRGYRFIACLEPVAGVIEHPDHSTSAALLTPSPVPGELPPVLAALPSSSSGSWRSTSGRFNFLMFALAICVVLSGVLLWVVRWFPAPQTWPSNPRLVRLTAYVGFESTPSFSPDSRQLAFAWNGSGSRIYDIFVKVAGEGEPVQLTSNPADEISPAWSPNGRSIAFLRRSSNDRAAVFVKPVLGGVERKLREVSFPMNSMAEMQRLAWSPDGKWLEIGGSAELHEKQGVRLIALSDNTVRSLIPSSAEPRID
ncbi:MAG: winged helix-turn-helix domain-containing protein, partial [Bryobacteraceae bacterium]|nr:winged helix-turn-helix domain-containing protein [Bryobacteraceae bacterium]